MAQKNIERSINSSFALINHDEEFLAFRREDGRGWEWAGGGAENDEYDIRGTTMVREIKEEGGFSIQQKKLRLCAVLGQKLHKETSEQFGGIQYGTLFLYYCKLSG